MTNLPTILKSLKHVYIVKTDVQGRYTFVNEYFSGSQGMKGDDMIGQSSIEQIIPEDRDLCRALVAKCLGTPNTFFSEILRKPDSADGIVINEWEFAAMAGEDGVPVEILCVGRDISAKELAIKEKDDSIEALAVEKHRLSSLIDGTNLGTWEWNVQTGETVFNERWAEIIGYSLKELGATTIDTWVAHCLEEDLPLSEEALKKHFDGEHQYYDVQLRMRHKNGTIIYVWDRGKVISFTSDGNPLMMYGTHMDITAEIGLRNELLSSKEQLQAALEDRNILFRELHHRIKNNLNMISNLLILKSKFTKNHEVLDFITETSNRIFSIAQTHDQILHLEELDLLYTKTYLEKLITSLVASYAADPKKYPLKLNIENHQMHIDIILTLGLLVNEIVSNSIKYAYAPELGGELSLAFHQVENQFVLEVGDQGKGKLSPSSSSSLGIKLIETFIQQLKGTLTLHTEKGLRYSIAFPITNYESTPRTNLRG